MSVTLLTNFGVQGHQVNVCVQYEHAASMALSQTKLTGHWHINDKMNALKCLTLAATYMIHS